MNNQLITSVSTKVCSHCKVEKPVDEFYFKKDRNCYDWYCKKCNRQHSKKWQIKNYEYHLSHPPNVLSKICSQCKQEKPISEFHKRKDGKDGFRNICKICFHQETTRCYFKYKEKRQIYHKQWNFENKDSIKLKNKKHNLEHKDEISLRRKKRLDYRMKTDINFKIIRNYRGRVYRAIKNNIKSGHTLDLIMCSIPELKLHIEKQFLLGMTWDNWGKGLGKWQLDHIIPCSFFNMLDPVEQYMCFRWQNLQPLWWEDNRMKSDNVLLSSYCLNLM